MRRKIVIFGSTGKLGSALDSHFQSRGDEVVRFDVRDVENLAQLEARVRGLGNATWLYCAAVLGLEHCERNPAEAFRVNGVIPGALARLADKSGSRFIYFSTEYVFTNEFTSGPFHEEDEPCPCNVYGMSKRHGELEVQAHSDDAVVIRLPLLFGGDPKRVQVIEKLLFLTPPDEEVRVSVDAFTTPGYVADIAGRMQSWVEGGFPARLLHLSGGPVVSLFDFLAAINAALGGRRCLAPAHTHDFGGVAKRALRLGLTSLRSVPLPSWQDRIEDFRNILLSEASS